MSRIRTAVFTHLADALGAALIAIGVVAAASAQELDAALLTGTLKKIRDTGSVTIGYRESSFPFSYVGPGNVPTGYSIDLCLAIVDQCGVELDGRSPAVSYRPVTPDARMQAVTSGAIDLECGTTTNNASRRTEVAFSPIFFVSGTKLLVRRSDRIRSFGELRNKTVVVTAHTTNEQVMTVLNEKQKLGMKLVAANDHDEAFKVFASGDAAAFAADDVILYGWIARNATQEQYIVAGDYLSYDPYGIMFRKNDPQLASVVERTFRLLAESRELEWIYRKWFQRRLASGENLALPMSEQLRSIFESLGLPEE